MDAQRAELLERIKGEVRAIGDGKVEEIKQAAQSAIAYATTEIDKLIAGYEAVVEAMPLDLLEVAKCGGTVVISEWEDATQGQFEVLRQGSCRPIRGSRATEFLPPGNYRVVLVVMPIAKAKGK